MAHESRYYARHYSSRGTILARTDAGGVGVMTPLGAIELRASYGSPHEVYLRSPDGHRLILVPEASNVIRVEVDGWHSREGLVPPHPADSAIAKIVEAIDDLRVEAALSHRADHTRTIEQRRRNANHIDGLCDKIQTALLACVTGK